jgi:hypothetical protein
VSIVFDFKAIKAALPSVIEGGDNHYPVAQPMAVETTGVSASHTHTIGLPSAGEGSIDYSHVYGDHMGFTGHDGRAWFYNAYEDRWEHRPQDGSIVVSFVRPA